MNQAKITGMKRDFALDGRVHWSTVMYMSGKELRQLARKIGLRTADKLRLAAMPDWKKQQIKQSIASQSRGSLLKRVKEAFRKVIRP